jgi:hypothetical protein
VTLPLIINFPPGRLIENAAIQPVRPSFAGTRTNLQS